MIKKAWIILIFVPLIATGALVLIYAFRHEIRIPPEPGKTAEYRLKGDFPAKWVARETGGQIRSMETDGSAIYYTSRGAAALDAATGAKKWETEPWAKTPLALGEGMVAYGGTDGTLYAFDAASGAERWRVKLSGSEAAPEISGGAVYYGEGGLVHAFDAVTGREKWRLAASGPVTAIAAGGGTVGILARNAVARPMTSSTLIVADAASGAEKWKFTQKAEFASIKIKGRLIYLLKRYFDVQGGPSSYLTAMDAASGEVKWEKQAQIFAPAIEIIDGTLYAGSTGREEEAFLHGFDPDNGAETFSVELGRQQAAPKVFAITDGFVYSSSASELYAADAATGELKWVARTDRPLTTTPLVADDSLCFAYGTANAIYALQLPSR